MLTTRPSMGLTMRSHKDQKDVQFPNGSTYVFSLIPPSLLCVKGIEPVSQGKVSNFKIDSFFSNEMKIGAHLRKSSDDSSQQFHVFENLQKMKGKLIFEIIPHSGCHHVPSFPQQISLKPLCLLAFCEGG